MKTTHTKQNKELKKENSEDRATNNRRLFISSLVVVFISITPYIYYSYNSVPETEIWETFLFTFKSEYYKNANDFAWLFLGKFIPWSLLILWFITCKHWWYHALLIPIAMYSFQLFTVINDDFKYVDELEIYWLIPIMMIVIPIVYFIRIKLFDKYVYGIDLKKIEAELDEYERKEKEDSETDIIK